MTDNMRDRIAAALRAQLNDECGDCWRRGDERDGCNCVYPKGHPSR
jgi:hypothetical protein